MLSPSDLVFLPGCLLPLFPALTILWRRFRARGTRPSVVTVHPGQRRGTGPNDEPPWWAWVLLVLVFLASLTASLGYIPTWGYK